MTYLPLSDLSLCNGAMADETMTIIIILGYVYRVQVRCVRRQEEESKKERYISGTVAAKSQPLLSIYAYYGDCLQPPHRDITPSPPPLTAEVL